MNKIILSLLLLAASYHELQAQIGISTEHPLEIFHADPLRNTNSTLPATYTDDVIFTSGKLGLGVLTPDRTLDLKQSFRYSDGNEGLNNVLYVNDQKEIRWEVEKPAYPPLVSVPAATLASKFLTFTLPNNSINTYKYTGVSMTLTRGIWLVYLKTGFLTPWNLNTSGNMRALLCSSSTGNGLATSEGAITSSASTNNGIGYFSGYIFISVTQPTKTYYLWLGYISGYTTIKTPTYNASTANGLNSFYAIRYSTF